MKPAMEARKLDLNAQILAYSSVQTTGLDNDNLTSDDTPATPEATP